MTKPPLQYSRTFLMVFFPIVVLCVAITLFVFIRNCLFFVGWLTRDLLASVYRVALHKCCVVNL